MLLFGIAYDMRPDRFWRANVGVKKRKVENLKLRVKYENMCDVHSMMTFWPVQL